MITSIEAYSNWRKGNLETNSLSTAQWRDIIEVGKLIGLGALAVGAIFAAYKWLQPSGSQQRDMEDLINGCQEAMPLFDSLKSKLPKEEDEAYAKSKFGVENYWNMAVDDINEHNGRVTQNAARNLASCLNVMCRWFSAYDEPTLLKLAQKYKIIKLK